MTPQEAGLASVLSTDTFGTHWNVPFNLSRSTSLRAADSQPGLFANRNGQLAVTWVQGVDNETADVFYARGVWEAAAGIIDWDDPVSLSSQASASLAASAAEPQIRAGSFRCCPPGVGGRWGDFLQPLPI